MREEPRTDQVRDAFAALTGSIDPHLRPPGVGSVRDTVHRRRQRRLIGVAAAAVAVATVVGLAQLPAMEQPAPVAAERPAPVRTSPPSAPQPPLAPPTRAPVSAGNGTDAADGPVATATSTPARAPGGQASVAPTARPPACASAVHVSRSAGNLVIIADPVCAGETIAVSWVTYEARADGSQRLFAHERLTLTAARHRITTTLRESPTCVGAWYVLRGDPSIPATIGAEDVEPFPGGTVVASQDGEICLS
ncbi:hypothetical protein [Asanoa siamensis]|uniref:Uncharacterized protein n=1 Tax=Asanoa siamensis TaxID=926357 RepID=A0ABQ4D0S4_9ACTN|nr:hypothetical protein [Asanoa siamensis]GIF76702.1 hypothetical protein Asi02nite_62200 [Asanoa siamensis]